MLKTDQYVANFVPSPGVVLETNLVHVWEHSFGGGGDDILSSAVNTRDGGILLGGVSNSKSAPSEAADAKQSPNLGGQDFWVVKLDSNGLSQWERTYGGTNDDNLHAIVAVKGGGYLLAGDTAEGGGGTKTVRNLGGTDGWLVRIDDDGHELWQTNVGSGKADQLISVVQTFSGGFVGGGNSGNDLWLFDLSADGKTSSNWNLAARSSRDYDSIQSLVATSEGVFASGQTSPWIPWTGQYTDDGVEVRNPAQAPVFGNIINNASTVRADGLVSLAGYTENADHDGWLGHISRDFTIEQDRQLSGVGASSETKNDRLHALAWLSDGALLTGGESSSEQGGSRTVRNFGDSDYWLLKFREQDGKLEKLWDYSWGGTLYDSIAAVLETPDGGYVLAGYSASAGSTNRPQTSTTPGASQVGGADTVDGIARFGTKHSTNHGGVDWWVLKVAEIQRPTGTPNIFANGLYSLSDRHEFLTTNEVEISISSSLGDPSIYYTLDGRFPTKGNSLQYTNRFRIRPPATILTSP